ncbi:MAG: hypothetical protein HYV09_03450 [Deltaproteobacteria bacterium]|nr:hypothetical protein [Deltaproteobacteria bacterium]
MNIPFQRFVHIDRFTVSRTATSETIVVEGIDSHGDEAVFIASMQLVDVRDRDDDDDAIRDCTCTSCSG